MCLNVGMSFWNRRILFNRQAVKQHAAGSSSMIGYHHPELDRDILIRPNACWAKLCERSSSRKTAEESAWEELHRESCMEGVCKRGPVRREL